MGIVLKKIRKMIDEVEFINQYERASEVTQDFENKYDGDEYWTQFLETEEEKKDRVRSSLTRFVNECRNRYLELKDKYDAALREKLSNFDIEEVGYWRKANQIHKWFVENVQGGIDNCDYHEVSKAQLEKLKGTVQLTLNNLDHAETLLPTCDGFFLDSIEYDEHYKADLEHTLKILDKVLKETDFENEVIVYLASW